MEIYAQATDVEKPQFKIIYFHKENVNTLVILDLQSLIKSM